MSDNCTYRVFFDTDTDREFMIHPGKFSALETPAEWHSIDKASRVAKTVQSKLRSFLYIMETNTETNQIRYFLNDGKTMVNYINKVDLNNVKNIQRAILEKKAAEKEAEPLQTAEKTAVLKEEPKTAPVQKTEQAKPAVSNPEQPKEAPVQKTEQPKPVQPVIKVPVPLETKPAVPAKPLSVPEDLFETANSFLEVIKNLPALISLVANQLSREDQSISDVLHYIELHDDISPDETASLVASIRAHRLQRRKYKDQFDLLIALKSDISQASGNRMDMPNATRIVRSVMSERKYRPRIILSMSDELESHALPVEEKPLEKKEEAPAPSIEKTEVKAEEKPAAVDAAKQAVKTSHKPRRMPRARRVNLL